MKINLILISIACAVLFEVAKANEEEQDGAFRMVDDLTKADYLANWAMRELPAKYSPFSVMNVLNIQIQETRDGHSRYKFDAELLIGHGVGDYNRDIVICKLTILEHKYDPEYSDTHKVLEHYHCR